MNVRQAMHLSAIIGIVCLSGGCLSIPQEPSNSTPDQKNQTSQIRNRKQMEMMKISKKCSKNETFHDFSPLFIINNTSEISNSSEYVLMNNVNCENKTIHILDDFADGNKTIKLENLSLQQFDYGNLNLKETAGFVAVGFLAFSVISYVGFVLWRRHLQKKYGTGQVLITEDVYDISDLRNFEI